MKVNTSLSFVYPYTGNFTLNTCKDTNSYPQGSAPKAAPPIKSYKLLSPDGLPVISATIKEALRNQTISIGINASCRAFKHISTGIMTFESFLLMKELNFCIVTNDLDHAVNIVGWGTD
jgi:hypothetical protein